MEWHSASALPLLSPPAIKYSDLFDNHAATSCISKIKSALGCGGLGILCITGVGHLAAQREQAYTALERVVATFDSEISSEKWEKISEILSAFSSVGLGSDVPLKPKGSSGRGKGKGGAGGGGGGKAKGREPVPNTFAVTKLIKTHNMTLLDGNVALVAGTDADTACADYPTDDVRGDMAVLTAGISASLCKMSTEMTRIALQVMRLCDKMLGLEGADTLLGSALPHGSGKARLIHYRNAMSSGADSSVLTNTAKDTLSTVAVDNSACSSNNNKAAIATKHSPAAVSDGSRSSGLLRDLSDWQGWHYDYGLVTALMTPRVSVHAPSTSTGDASSEIAVVDAPCGLVVLPPWSTDDSGAVLVDIPPDSVAIQIGEAAQILSHNQLMATPHAVVRPKQIASADADALSRIQRQIAVVFVQPAWEVKMAPLTTLATDGAPTAPDIRLSDVLPPLETRWTPGASFSDFSRATTAGYYGKSSYTAKGATK